MGRTSLRPWFMGNKMQFEAVACRLFLHYSYTLAQKASNYGIFCFYNKLALFVGGTLFGSVGIKLLSSKDAKKAYVHATAAGLRMKDYVMETVTTVQENASDILASAKDLNEERAAKEAEEAAAAQLETSEEE